jgi:hypothetical protein
VCYEKLADSYETLLHLAAAESFCLEKLRITMA